MSCLYPNLIYKYKKPTDEKWNVFFCKNRYPDEKNPYVYDRKMKLRDGYQAEFAYVGCGQCVQCRLQKSREWANRCALESLMYDKSRNYFITLTYDDSHLPLSAKSGLCSLRMDDVSAFNKRLRRHNSYHYGEDKIRFYVAGEYGDTTSRAHYHILLYNITIPDLKLISHNKFGNPLYTSQTIDDLWGHGFCCIGELNWNTAAYTARYVMKKQYGSNALMYKDAGIEPPSTRMSRMPGIGVPWFELYGDDLYRQVAVNDEGFPIFKDRITIPSNGDQPLTFKPPRIFEKRLQRILILSR